MDTKAWLEWTRTRLREEEAEALCASLTPEQRAHLTEHDFVWLPGVGVLHRDPRDPPGRLRRARFTHGTYFETRDGGFYIRSDGEVRRLGGKS